MQKNLNYYKKILQDKSRNLSFSDYLKYITSWQEMSFYKFDGFVSKFPDSDRIKGITTIEKFDEEVEDSMKNNDFLNLEKSFFENFGELFKSLKMPQK